MIDGFDMVLIPTARVSLKLKARILKEGGTRLPSVMTLNIPLAKVIPRSETTFHANIFCHI